MLFNAFVEKDMSLLEVNPLIVTKATICNCSTPRSPSTVMLFSAILILLALRDLTEEDEKKSKP